MLRAALTLFFICSLIIETKSFGLSEYKINTAPLRKHEALSQEFEFLHDKFQTQPLTIKEHERRIEILDYVLSLESDWLDGYWLHGSESFILGSSYPDEKDFPKARIILSKGLERIESCLKKAPDHMLCKFFQGSLLAKIASIDGIFASLKHGKTIRDAFYAVTKSDYNLKFRPNVSLKGAAFYGLGLFYRLVPDIFLIDWIWGIRGNIDHSIELHKTATEFDKYNPCSLLMLSVAQLCRYHDEDGHPEYKSAMIGLDRAQKITPIDNPQAVCVRESYKIQVNPSRTCGYTQAKYREESKED